MEEFNTNASQLLYKQSSQLRALARMLSGSRDTERPDLTLTPIECDGLAAALISVSDCIDEVRDMS